MSGYEPVNNNFGKPDKMESLNLEQLIQERNEGIISKGGFNYHPADHWGHQSHIDLNVTMGNGEKRNYRLFNPAGEPVVHMNPYEIFKFKGPGSDFTKVR